MGFKTQKIGDKLLDNYARGIIELCSVDFIHSGYVIIVDSCAYKNKQFSKTKQYTQHTP